MKKVAVIPAYNESAVLSDVVRQVRNFVDEVVVVDDGSTDMTTAVAKAAGATVLRHLVNCGQGAALRTGTDYALAGGADLIVHFDADGQQNPLEIDSLVRPVLDGQVEVVLGSRFLSTQNKVPLLRRLILKGGIIFTRFFSGVRLTDVHNGFRVLSRRAAEKIEISQDRMAHASEIIDQIIRHQLSYLEKPVSVRYTPYSQGKGQRAWGSLRIVRDFLLAKLIGR